mmetsp:Transcript_40263/g.113856  ORF Transcript_40263/g.113856 Transcript_40263/m.113856 type:complete len:241 (+) Transcript_40263:72-794(+)
MEGSEARDHAADMEDRDLRIQELEAIVEQQRAKIEHLEALSSQEELAQLQEIIEAQEAALTDQRRIIENQSALLEELNVHMQTSRAMPLAETPEYPPELDTDGANNRSSLSYTPTTGAPRRRINPAAPSRTSQGGVVGQSGSQGRIQKVLGGRPAPQQQQQPQQQSPRVDAYGRPNSAPRGMGSGPPRAKSWNTERLDHEGKTAQLVRGPSPRAPRQQHHGAPRRVGGALPPAAPQHATA